MTVCYMTKSCAMVWKFSVCWQQVESKSKENQIWLGLQLQQRVFLHLSPSLFIQFRVYLCFIAARVCYNNKTFHDRLVVVYVLKQCLRGRCNLSLSFLTSYHKKVNKQCRISSVTKTINFSDTFLKFKIPLAMYQEKTIVQRVKTVTSHSCYDWK